MGRIRYGVKSLTAIFGTVDDLGVITYDNKVMKIPGAKSISLEPQGDSNTESADNIDWFVDDANNGYTFSFEVEDTPEGDEFITKANGFKKDETTGMIVEDKDAVKAPFALLGEFGLAGGKETGKRFVLYNCTIKRNTIAGSTNESGKKTIGTNSISGTALPRVNDGKVKATAVSSDAIYGSWFTKVPEVSTE